MTLNKITFADGTELNKYEAKIILLLMSGCRAQVIELARFWKDTNLKKYSDAIDSLYKKGFVSSHTKDKKTKYTIKISRIVTLTLANIDIFLDEITKKEAEKRLDQLISNHYRYVMVQKIQAIGCWNGNCPIATLREILNQLFLAIFDINLRSTKEKGIAAEKAFLDELNKGKK